MILFNEGLELSMDFEFYLKEINFDKQLEKLEKNCRGKKVIIYGAGSLFRFIQNNYNLSKLNIIGISDKKYTISDEGKDDLGYKKIPIFKIPDYTPDCILLAVLNYFSIKDNLENCLSKEHKIKIRPLARKCLLDSIKEIWNME